MGTVDTNLGKRRHWVRRSIIILGLALVALAMLRNSLGAVFRPQDPALSLRIDPGNAEALADRAEQILWADPSLQNRALAERMALKSLNRSPISAAGARILATTRAMAGDTRGVRPLMEYAEGVSRRDLPTELWLIEDAVGRNDIPSALHHYDIALRGSAAARPILFPILVQATSHREVGDHLIQILNERPMWAEAFVAEAAQSAPNYHGLVRLLLGLARSHFPLEPIVIARASERMTTAHQYDLAWQAYKAGHPSADHDGLRDPNFAEISSEGAPFDWFILSDSGISAGPSPNERGRLAFNAPTGAGGVVARQMLLLPAAKFILSGRAFTSQPGEPPVQLRLTCVTGPSVAVIAATPGRRFSQRFLVPANCPAQWLEIAVDGGDSPVGASGEIGELDLRSDPPN